MIVAVNVSWRDCVCCTCAYHSFLEHVTVRASDQCTEGRGLGRGDSHIKVTGMLIVSLRGVNCRFWSHLRCQYMCPFRYHLGLCIKKFTKNAITPITQNSPLEVSLSLSHTHISLPQGCNFNFLMSIPVTFIWESPCPSSVPIENSQFFSEFFSPAHIISSIDYFNPLSPNSV